MSIIDQLTEGTVSRFTSSQIMGMGVASTAVVAGTGAILFPATMGCILVGIAAFWNSTYWARRDVENMMHGWGLSKVEGAAAASFLLKIPVKQRTTIIRLTNYPDISYEKKKQMLKWFIARNSYYGDLATLIAMLNKLPSIAERLQALNILVEMQGTREELAAVISFLDDPRWPNVKRPQVLNMLVEMKKTNEDLAKLLYLAIKIGIPSDQPFRYCIHQTFKFLNMVSEINKAHKDIDELLNAINELSFAFFGNNDFKIKILSALAKMEGNDQDRVMIVKLVKAHFTNYNNGYLRIFYALAEMGGTTQDRIALIDLVNSKPNLGDRQESLIMLAKVQGTHEDRAALVTQIRDFPNNERYELFCLFCQNPLMQQYLHRIPKPHVLEVCQYLALMLPSDREIFCKSLENAHDSINWNEAIKFMQNYLADHDIQPQAFLSIAPPSLSLIPKYAECVVQIINHPNIPKDNKINILNCFLDEIPWKRIIGHIDNLPASQQPQALEQFCSFLANEPTTRINNLAKFANAIGYWNDNYQDIDYLKALLLLAKLSYTNRMDIVEYMDQRRHSEIVQPYSPKEFAIFCLLAENIDMLTQVQVTPDPYVLPLCQCLAKFPSVQERTVFFNKMMALTTEIGVDVTDWNKRILIMGLCQPLPEKHHLWLSQRIRDLQVERLDTWKQLILNIDPAAWAWLPIITRLHEMEKEELFDHALLFVTAHNIYDPAEIHFVISTLTTLPIDKWEQWMATANPASWKPIITHLRAIGLEEPFVPPLLAFLIFHNIDNHDEMDHVISTFKLLPSAHQKEWLQRINELRVSSNRSALHVMQNMSVIPPQYWEEYVNHTNYIYAEVSRLQFTRNIEGQIIQACDILLPLKPELVSLILDLAQKLPSNYQLAAISALSSLHFEIPEATKTALLQKAPKELLSFFKQLCKIPEPLKQEFMTADEATRQNVWRQLNTLPRQLWERFASLPLIEKERVLRFQTRQVASALNSFPEDIRQQVPEAFLTAMGLPLSEEWKQLILREIIYQKTEEAYLNSLPSINALSLQQAGGLNAHNDDVQLRVQRGIELLRKRQGNLSPKIIAWALAEFEQNLKDSLDMEEKDLAEKALKTVGIPIFPPFLGEQEPWGILGTLITGEEIIARIWIFTLTLAPEDRAQARESMIAALANCLELDGRRVCNQGKAARLFSQTLNGRLKGVDFHEVHAPMSADDAALRFFNPAYDYDVVETEGERRRSLLDQQDGLPELLQKAEAWADENNRVPKEAFLAWIREAHRNLHE